MAGLILEIRALRCGYAAQEVISGLDLSVAEGRIHCLLGPSGCGKSTVMRAVGGFLQPAAGTISLRGVCVADQHVSVPPERRAVGWMTQDFSLFPHLTVADNVGFGLHRDPARAARIAAWLERVGIEDLAARMPHELSGGQQQRVALARALAPGPDLLLLDEPFSALDRQLRESMIGQCRELLKAQGATVLMVTHDQDEAFAMGDEISVMRAGRIEQTGTPRELYTAPASPFVADFVGVGVWLRECPATDGRIRTPVGELPRPGREQSWDVLVRPDQLQLSEAGIAGSVAAVHQRDSGLLAEVRLGSGEAVLVALAGTVPEVGEAVHVRRLDVPLVAFPTSGS